MKKLPHNHIRPAGKSYFAMNYASAEQRVGAWATGGDEARYRLWWYAASYGASPETRMKIMDQIKEAKK
jgi:hypothetical protein